MFFNIKFPARNICYYIIPDGIRTIRSNASAPHIIPKNKFLFFGFISGTKLEARKKGMYVVMNTGSAPHHGYTQIKAGVDARKISTRLKPRALITANRSLLLIPEIFLSLSSGSSFQATIPAMENIIDSSQQTPIRSI